MDSSKIEQWETSFFDWFGFVFITTFGIAVFALGIFVKFGQCIA